LWNSILENTSLVRREKIYANPKENKCDLRSRLVVVKGPEMAGLFGGRRRLGGTIGELLIAFDVASTL
jgi:hypothetical protein